MLPREKIIAVGLGLIVLIAAGYVISTTKPWEEKVLSPGEQAQLQEAQVAELIKTGDPSQCDKAKGIVIDGTPYETVCLNNVYENLAEQTLDASYCDKLDNQMLSIAVCKSKILTMRLSTATSSAMCNTAGSSDLKNSCLTQYWSIAAKKEGNAKLCSNIPLASASQRCSDSFYIMQLAAGKDVSCSVFSSEVRADCQMFQSALSSKTPSQDVCYSIDTPELQNLCITRTQ